MFLFEKRYLMRGQRCGPVTHRQSQNPCSQRPFSREQREIVGAYVNHLIVRLAISLMIFLDIICVIVAVSLPASQLLVLITKSNIYGIFISIVFRDY